MSKKTLALIIGLVALTALLLVIALSTKEPKNTANNQQAGDLPSPTPAAQSVLSMTPSVVDLTDGIAGQQSVNVDIETGENQVTAVQLEVAYDPDVLSNVTLRPGTFFASPTVLLNQADTQNGRVSYALGIAPAQDPVSGQGVVATITFTVRPNSGVTESEITLLPKSLVTARGVGSSVLKSSSGVKIMLPQGTAVTQPAQTTVTTAPTTPAQ